MEVIIELTEIVQAHFGGLLNRHLMPPTIRKGTVLRVTVRRNCGRLEGSWPLDHLQTTSR